MTIGLLVRRVDLNEYDRALWMAAYDAAQSCGANLLLVGGHSAFDPDRTDAAYSALYSMLNSRLFDGCVLSQTVALWLSPEEIERFAGELPSLPLISTSMRFGNHPCVSVDNTPGLRSLMRHLIEEHGCRRIVHVRGPHPNREAQLREDIWREELVRAGIDPAPEWLVQGHYWRQQLDGIGARVLEQTKGEFDAVVACNDQAAFRLIEDFQALGFRIPEDYRVCGFDDNEQAQYSTPKLTTVKQPMEALLRQCWAKLEDFVRTGQVPADQTVDTSLVIRESCGCHFQGEADAAKALTWAAYHRQVSTLLTKVQDSSGFDRAMNQVASLEELKAALLLWLPRVGIARFSILRTCTEHGHPAPFTSYREPGRAVDVGPDAFLAFVDWSSTSVGPITIPSAQLTLPDWIGAEDPCSVGLFPLVVGDVWYGLAFLELSRDAGLWERSVQEQVASVFHRLELEKRTLEEKTRAKVKTEQLEAHNRLVSQVAHEINTPLGAILSCSATVEQGLTNFIEQAPDFFSSLTPEGQDLYASLMMSRPSRGATVPQKRDRLQRSHIVNLLTGMGLAEPTRTAEGLVSLGWKGKTVDLEAMASIPGFETIVAYLCGMEDIVISSSVITTAAERVSDFVSRLVEGTRSELGDRRP